MHYFKKLFGNTKITWQCLILFAILIGIIVGVLNRISFLANTSFQDIAIVLDMWIVMAIFIIVNCKTWQEAAAKTFIFFLISQPLIYLTEIIIDTLRGANFTEQFVLYFKNYYIGAGWAIWTLLTIPGAFIAYQIKNNNVLAGIILSVATTYLAFAGAKSLFSSIYNFPYHLLNGMLCLIAAFILIYIILSNKTARIIAMVITSLGLIGGIYSFYNGKAQNEYWEEQTRLQIEQLDAEEETQQSQI